jgi:hypothetical protein
MYLNYCRGLRFEEAPDYMYLRQLFRYASQLGILKSLGLAKVEFKISRGSLEELN